MIRLSLLGPTTCLDPSGADLERVVRSPKRLALLSYLAVAPPRGFHRRDTLLGLFWPESDQRHARGALRQAVRHLRNDLGDAVVSRGQEELGLDWDRFWCDAVAFEEALEASRVAEAIDLYQRDLLDGFYLSGAPEFERWLDRERRRLQRRGAEAAWAFAEGVEDPTEAARWARRAARFTPRGETGVRRLMRFLDERGNAVGALREYERFRGRVEEELGTGPGPETRALVEAIREGTQAEVSALPSNAPTRTYSGSEAVSEPAAEALPRRRGLSLPATAHPIPARSRRLTRSDSTLLIAGSLLGLLATLGTAGLMRGSGDTFAFGAATHLTDEEGPEVEPVLSPSGDRVAYVTGEPRSTQIYVRRVAGGRPVHLTSELQGWHRSLTWSPDGERVAFLTYEEGGASTLYAVPATGGGPRVLFRAQPGAAMWAPAWSPDGEYIAFKRDRSIYKLEIETAALTYLTDAWAPHSLAWSPRGHRIAFVSENSSYSDGSNIAPSSIWVVSAEGGEARRITNDNQLNQSPVWWPDGRRLLFISNRDGTPDIYAIDLVESSYPAGAPVRLTTGLNPLSISLSADGKRLAYASSSVDADIWALRLPRWAEDGAPARLAEATRLLARRQISETLNLSPDGRWLAYDSNQAGNQDIYKMPVEGGEPIQLTRDPADDFAPVWSPDGSELVFYSFRNGNRDLFVTDSDGRNVEQVTFGAGSDAFPDWSPDGSSIVYQHNPAEGPGDFATLHRVNRIVEGGRTEGERTEGSADARWGPAIQLNDERSGMPRWSPDGHWIAYNSLRRIAVLSAATGEETVLLRDVTVAAPPVWSADSESLFFAARLDGVFALWRIPRTGGKPRPVAVDGDRPFERFWFDTDGERLFFTRLESHEADIWVVDLEGRP